MDGGLKEKKMNINIEIKGQQAHIVNQQSLISGTSNLEEIKFDFSVFFYVGMAIYLLGLALCAISMRDFARPDASGMNTKGLYRYSRNPMYVAYFICFLGIAFLTKSMIFILILVIFQTAAHWIILSEERWCLEKFGKSYQDY